MSRNCSVISIPTSKKYFESLHEHHYDGTLAVTSVALSFTIANIGLFIHHLIVINRFVSSEDRRIYLKWIAFLFPFTSVAAGTAASVPRSIPLMQVFISLYLARVMFTFVHYVRDLWGGRAKLVESLQQSNTKIKISTSPLCCCCVFLPLLEPTGRNVKIVERLATQIGFIRPLVTYVSLVGLSDMGGTSDSRTQFQTYVNVINIISAVISMWGLTILTTLSKEPLKHYSVFPMFKVIQLVIACANIQSAVLKILASQDVITCSDVLPAGARAEVWHHLALIIEVFLLSLAVTWFCGARHNAVFDKHPIRKGKAINDIVKTPVEPVMENGRVDNNRSGNPTRTGMEISY